MKTPEEIKNALDLCSQSGCPDCAKCAYDGNECCLEEKSKDALAYIQQLESRLAQVERERDAAVRDCARFPCYTCTEMENGDFCPQCRTTGTFRSLHEWRGVCPENTKEEK